MTTWDLKHREKLLRDITEGIRLLEMGDDDAPVHRIVVELMEENIVRASGSLRWALAVIVLDLAVTVDGDYSEADTAVVSVE